LSEPSDEEYAGLRDLLGPLNERLAKIGCGMGLHLTNYPKPYRAYYGHAFLFSEEKSDLAAEKLTAFVESTERRHAGYYSQNLQNQSKAQ
jgi:hypothetical protein